MEVIYTAQELTFGHGIYSWAGMALGDTGKPVGASGAGDRTVQVEGTFGVGGTVLIEGTLNMTTWYPLHDPFGSLLSFTAAGMKAILENVIAVRPNVSGGDGSTLITATIIARRSING